MTHIQQKKSVAITKVNRQSIPSYSQQFVNNEIRERLEHLVAPHVDSFDYFLTHGLLEAVKDIPEMEFKLDNDLLIKMRFNDAFVGYPLKNDDLCAETMLTPREARERCISYTSIFTTQLSIDISGIVEGMTLTARMGDLPIMVKSDRCHLKGLNAYKLVKLKEEANEMGGYFIMNGIERVIRLLQVPRRNYACAIERSSFKNRGPAYSDKGVVMRCVRSDQSSVTITLHYLNNGGATMKFVVRKQEFLLPVVAVAKALMDISDKELFDRIVQGDTDNTFMTTRLELLLRDAKQTGIYSKSEYLAYLGSLFRLFLPISDSTSDEEAGKLLVKRFFFVHVKDVNAKLECLLHMLRKLFAFAEGKCAADNADALMNHELLLPGHLITTYVKEKLDETLLAVRTAVLRDYRSDKAKCIASIKTPKYFQKHFDRFGGGIGSKIGTFLSTGNIVSSTGLDLMQVIGNHVE